jgi:hypothetical protein
MLNSDSVNEIIKSQKNDLMWSEAEHVKQIYESLRKSYSHFFEGELSTFDAINMVVDLMAMAKRFNVENKRKKQIILQVLKHIVDEEVCYYDDDEKRKMHQLIDLFIDPSIDVAFKYSKNIKPIIKKIFPCCYKNN